MSTTPSKHTPEQLAYDAMQEAIAYIQKQLGITAGDFAGAYFSDHDREAPMLEILSDYARHEARNAGHSYFIGDDWHCVCGNKTHLEGFQPCLKNGKVVWPTAETWTDGSLYRCISCSRIVEWNPGDEIGHIVGITAAEFLGQIEP